MKISYSLDKNKYSYDSFKNDEDFKLSSLLTNNVGDFLFLGVSENSVKSQGLIVSNSKTQEMFKIIEMIKPVGVDVVEVNYSGYKFSRKFESSVSQKVDLVDELDSDFTSDDDSNLSELDRLVDVQTTDSFYLAPTGGIIYEISNFDGEVEVDLDMRKLNDYTVWGRGYENYKKNGILFVKYTKTEENTSNNYTCFFGVKAVNFDYKIVDDWNEINYEYSKSRGSLFDWYIYKFLIVNVFGSKRMIIGYGFNETEVENQISLLEKNGVDLESIDKDISVDLTNTQDRFEKLISQDTSVAYSVSNNSLYKFYNSNLDYSSLKNGSFAGLPWFSQVWSRDELIALRALINNSEYNIVLNRINYYLDLIDSESGLLPRINEEGTLFSCDGIFWLSKRINDLIYDLQEKGRLDEILPKTEIVKIYERLTFSFDKIISTIWDKDEELLSVKNGDSWMDTIDVEYPIDIQVQMLSFVSNLADLSEILELVDDSKIYLDLEKLIKGKIRAIYFRNNNLYQEKNSEIITSNIFLVYYIYPSLFENAEWEIIFDNALRVLYNNWGSISTLSRLNKNYVSNYAGEGNSSYHQGDSWYFMNNIAAMVLNHLNFKKYEKYITKIMISSTNDILKQGCIGFGSEVSSASNQRAEGSLAQLWSTSTYLEMIDKLCIRKL